MSESIITFTGCDGAGSVCALSVLAEAMIARRANRTYLPPGGKKLDVEFATTRKLENRIEAPGSELGKSQNWGDL